jgi:hypothetical protein
MGRSKMDIPKQNNHPTVDILRHELTQIRAGHLDGMRERIRCAFR